MNKIRLLLIEDNRLLRERIVALLSEQPDCEVVAEAATARDVIAKALELKPSVVLVNSGIQNGDAADTLGAFRRRLPRAKLVVMNLISAQDNVLDWVRAGASGFILREATSEELVNTIRSVAQGEKVLPADLTAALFSQIFARAARL